MDVSLESQTKPLSNLSSFSYVPPRRHEPKEMSYFNTESKVRGFDMKLHREDRKHYKGRGLSINEEEKSRTVPVLSSSEYGRRSVPVLYQTNRQYAHVACMEAEFFMKNGIIWNVAEGYGSVTPI
uniref:Cilia and flagella associated protein 90 n=1 Tax=Mastacembelus armatus TaxID=205130 RepID=A0A7N8YQU4_9TELE